MNKLLPPNLFCCKNPVFGSVHSDELESRSMFEKAVDDSKKLMVKPDAETLLQLYSLYKQATIGDVNTAPPNAFNIVAKAKHDAWSSLKGKSQKEAAREYVELVNNLKQTH